MRHYCTLFDSSYLAKGLAMHNSLRKHSSERFTLHVLPLDDNCFWMLNALELPDVELFDLKHFESLLHLQRDRERRTKTEYCWMLASVFTDFIMSQYGLIEMTSYESVQRQFAARREIDSLTYLDSDLFFFSDPAPVFDEIGKRSIAITPHRLIPSKKYLEVNGIYNVGWVTFRNDSVGRDCVREWAGDCRDWCFNRVEVGRFGDQKYLDAWPRKYGDAVCELGIGVNVAPWNVGNWHLTPGPCVDGVPVICYHLHEFAEMENNIYKLTNYELSPAVKDLIYDPYIAAYENAKRILSGAYLKLESERA